MEEDYDRFDQEPEGTDPAEGYEQDGPDLFGGEGAPVAPAGDEDASRSASTEEPAPLEDADDDEEGGDLPPDGLETEDTDLEGRGPTGRAEPAEDYQDPADLPRDEAPEAPLALYRRYRPETFDEVIGQEHVTEPLKRAIVNNRVNHAYLFSGPRGCGKTTSARILARALNCEQGPTPTPCGVCQSCRDLARGGPGSIDVIEIDAASHGGVDDARDLRERAFFAPVHSRYKVYIIDEAHMVTTQGFNALLKLVEEPPPHVKFVFATTEPDKVIGTIRSRTHHYPFRLVPPKTLVSYLETLCHKEGIDVDHAVLPLVVRAGGGSVRDCLSVLDQLLGGADADGVSYEQASALLGFTPDALLDQIVDAFAAGDAHEVFATIDKVIEVGQDPRRFAEDLLRRFRDLVILAAVPDACRTGLIDVSEEQATRLSHQVAGMGSGELTRAAEVLARGLTEMRGTTAPRLHLELMCSRILLPGADTDGRGIHARLERLERRVGMAALPQDRSDGPGGHGADADTAVATEGTGPETAPARVRAGSPGTRGQEPSAARPSAEAPTRRPRPRRDDVAARAGSAAPRDSADGGAPNGSRPDRPGPHDQALSGQPSPGRDVSHDPWSGTGPRATEHRAVESGRDVRGGNAGGAAVDQPAPRGSDPGEQAGIGQGPDISVLRREWPRVLEAVRSRGRFVALVLGQYAQVLDVHDNQATLGFANTGARDSFLQGNHQQVLHDAVVEVLGASLTFVPVMGDVAPRGGQGGSDQRPAASRGGAQRGPRQQPGEPGGPRPGGASDQPARRDTNRGGNHPGRSGENRPRADGHGADGHDGEERGDAGHGDPARQGRWHPGSQQPGPGRRGPQHPGSGGGPQGGAGSDADEDAPAADVTTSDDARDDVIEGEGPVPGAPDPRDGTPADEPDLVPTGRGHRDDPEGPDDAGSPDGADPRGTSSGDTGPGSVAPEGPSSAPAPSRDGREGAPGQDGAQPGAGQAEDGKPGNGDGSGHGGGSSGGTRPAQQVASAYPRSHFLRDRAARGADAPPTPAGGAGPTATGSSVTNPAPSGDGHGQTPPRRWEQRARTVDEAAAPPPGDDDVPDDVPEEEWGDVVEDGERESPESLIVSELGGVVIHEEPGAGS